MTLLILGLLIWVVAHLFKRLAPDLRAQMGDAAKGGVALASVVAIGLMAIGFWSADDVHLYTPMAGMGHLNNLLVLIAILMFGAGSKGSWLASRMRHPMLIGTKVWAVAHLLVNGDLASVILFGGLLIWAIVEVILINRGDGVWEKPAATRPTQRDVVLVLVWTGVYVAIALIHWWLGHNPFLGSYS